jgi:hypothetical protein
VSAFFLLGGVSLGFAISPERLRFEARSLRESKVFLFMSLDNPFKKPRTETKLTLPRAAEVFDPASIVTDSPSMTSDQWEHYWDGYKTIEGWRYDTSKSYDTALLTLSVAVIGGLLTFLTQLQSTPDDIYYFDIACGALGMATLMTLFAFLLMDAAMRRVSENLADMMTAGSEVKRTWINRVLPWTPRIAGLAFATGLFFAFFFVNSNYSKIVKKADGTNTKSTSTQAATAAAAKTDSTSASIPGRTATKELRPGSH